MSAINLTVTSVNGIDVTAYTETFTIGNIITAFTKATGDTSYTAVSVVTYRGANGRIDNFGVSESISTIRAGISEYDIACTVTELRGGTNNIDFVSALTLADQGFVFGAGTYGFTGTYTVTGDTVLNGDVSLGALPADVTLIKGRVSTNTAAGSAIQIDATTCTYSEGLELRYNMADWVDGAVTFTSAKGMYLRMETNEANAAGSVYGMELYGTTNNVTVSGVWGLLSYAYIKGSTAKNVATAYGVQAELTWDAGAAATTIGTEAASILAKITGGACADYTKIHGIIVRSGDMDGVSRTYGNGILIEDDTAIAGTITWTKGINITSPCTTGISVTGASTKGIVVSGGATSQLELTSTVAQKGLVLADTLKTAGTVEITSTIADAAVNILSIVGSLSTAFSTGKTAVASQVQWTSNATDVTGSTLAGYRVNLIDTALSKASMIGYRVVHSGTASAAADTSNLYAFATEPTITINSATTNFIGALLDLSGMTITSANDVYGIKVVGMAGVDAGIAISGASTTGMSITGGTTEQLLLTASVAQKAITITQTAVTTGNAISITSGNNDATNQVVYLETNMTTAFSTAKTLSQNYYKHTSNATDVDGATVNAVDLSFDSIALSKISYNGFKFVPTGTLSAAAGTQTITGINIVPSALTINSATTTFSGINIDYTGVTNTASAGLYGIKLGGTQNIGLDMSGTFNGHGIYIHGATFAANKRALRIGDYGTEIALDGGEGLIRSYAKVSTGTGATALQFHWGFTEVAAASLIGNQMQYESQVTAVGCDTVLGNDIIVGIAAGKAMATTAGDMTKGLIGGRFKVYADVTSTHNGSVAALWLDNQINCAVGELECSIRSATGGSVPDAWALFNTTSAGWDTLLYFDSTMAAHEPIITSFAGNGAWVANNKGTFTQLGQIQCYIDGTGYVYIPFGSVA